MRLDLKEHYLMNTGTTWNFTCEAHESSLSGLLPQPLHIFVVNVDQINSLQSKCFGGHNNLLPCIKKLPGILSPRGT